MFRKHVHVYPSSDGQHWGVTTWRGYQAVWHSLRHWGPRVARHNVRALLDW